MRWRQGSSELDRVTEVTEARRRVSSAPAWRLTMWRRCRPRPAAPGRDPCGSPRHAGTPIRPTGAVEHLLLPRGRHEGRQRFGREAGRVEAIVRSIRMRTYHQVPRHRAVIAEDRLKVGRPQPALLIDGDARAVRAPTLGPDRARGRAGTAHPSSAASAALHLLQIDARRRRRRSPPHARTGGGRARSRWTVHHRRRSLRSAANNARRPRPQLVRPGSGLQAATTSSVVVTVASSDSVLSMTASA